MTKIVITRPLESTKSTIALAQNIGFGVLNFPLLELIPVNNVSLNRSLSDFDWILFTSSNAVRFFMDYCSNTNIEIPTHVKFAALGPTTKQSLDSFGLKVDFVPDSFNRTAISVKMPISKGERVLYPTIVNGPRQTEKVLRHRGCLSTRLNIYRSTARIYPDKKWQTLAENDPQVITFFSPRTVQAFFKNKQKSVNLKKYVIAVLAPSSARELNKFGYQAQITAETPTAENLLYGIKKYYE